MSISQSKQATVTTFLATSHILKLEGLCGFLNWPKGCFLLGFGGLDGEKDGLFASWVLCDESGTYLQGQRCQVIIHHEKKYDYCFIFLGSPLFVTDGNWRGFSTNHWSEAT